MKKFYQISSVILIIGLILLMFGKLHNGDQEIRTQSRYFHIHPQHHHHDDWDKRKIENTRLPVKQFTKIDLDLSRPDVHLVKGTGYQVVISGFNIKGITAKVKQHQLSISDSKQSSFYGWHHGYDITIMVPASAHLTELTGQSQEGDLYLNNLAIATINFNLNDGDLVMNRVKVKQADLQLGDGDLKLTDSTFWGTLNLGDGDLNISDSQLKLAARLDDGDTTIKNSKLLGNTSFRLEDGDFYLDRGGQVSYDLITNSDNDLRLGNQDYSGRLTKKIKGAPILKVTCVDGDIKID